MNLSFYTGLDILCLILLTILTVNMALLKYRMRNRTVIVTFSLAVLLIVLDFVWALASDGYISMQQRDLTVLNLFYDLVAVLVACSWAEYILDYSKTPLHLKLYRVLFELIPCAVVVFFGIASFWTDWMYSVDSSGGYHTGKYIFVYFLVILVPLLFSVAVTSFNIKSVPQKSEREKYCVLNLCAVLFIVMLCISQFDDQTPTICIGITLSVIIIAISVQNRMISKDSLTDLDNRQTLDRTLDAFFTERENAIDGTGQRTISVAVFDIDALKLIVNDYGHTESNKVVVDVADILKECCRRKPLVPALVTNNSYAVVSYGTVDELKETCTEFTGKIAEVDKTVPYMLHLSYGIATSDENVDSPKAIINLAEERMRAAKEEYYKLIGYKRRK